jgi:hypothetical protein
VEIATIYLRRIVLRTVVENGSDVVYTRRNTLGLGGQRYTGRELLSCCIFDLIYDTCVVYKEA